MFGKLITSSITLAMILGITASAQAFTGRTTDNTYKTGTQAAKATGAYYMSKALKRPYYAKDLRVLKRGQTPSSTVTSTWRLQTTKRTMMGYPMANVTVKVKKLSPNKWKGYTDGRNGVSFLKAAFR
jgi:hypothetical protein